MPYQLQTLVRWLANQRCQCTWDFSGDNLRHVSYLKNCRTLPSDVLSDIQVNWIRGSGVCVLDLIKAVALAVIFGNLQKSVVVKRWKPLRLLWHQFFVEGEVVCCHFDVLLSLCVYLQFCTLDPYPCWWFRLSKRCILNCWFGLKVVRSSVALEDLQGRAF